MSHASHAMKVSRLCATSNHQGRHMSTLITPDPHVGIVVLVEHDATEDAHYARSFFPLVLDGAPVRGTVTRVREWNDPIEAVVELATVPYRAWLAFFDASYFHDHEPFGEGGEIDFRIALLAYRMEAGEEQIHRLEDPETIRGMRGDTDDLSPIEVSTKGMRALVPTNAGIDETGFYGTVLDARPIAWRTGRLWRCVVEVGEDRRFPVYVAEANLDRGWRPRIGDWVQGVGWFNGYRAGSYEGLR